MRLDKYLRVSRLVKRRTVAKEMTDQGRIEVSGRVVKSSYDVRLDDIISIGYRSRTVKTRVLNIREITKKDEASELYEPVD